INARLDALEELVSLTIVRAEVEKDLGSILDLERLIAKISLASAGPRDVLALARSLAVIPSLKQRLTAKAPRLAQIRDEMDEVADVRDLILTAIAEEPPPNLADGGTIRGGYNAPLDELRDISHNSRTYLAQIEQRERGRTGIASLKVRFN